MCWFPIFTSLGDRFEVLVICVFFIFARATMPFIRLLERYLLYMFWYFTFIHWITAPFDLLYSFFWLSMPAYFIFIFVCLSLPSWLLICLCILIYIYPCTYPSYLCYRLKSVAEERMVQGLWLHRPAVLPLGVSDDLLDFSLRRKQRSSTTPLAQPPSTASTPCLASCMPGESFLLYRITYLGR